MFSTGFSSGERDLRQPLMMVPGSVSDLELMIDVRLPLLLRAPVRAGAVRLAIAGQPRLQLYPAAGDWSSMNGDICCMAEKEPESLSPRGLPQPITSERRGRRSCSADRRAGVALFPSSPKCAHARSSVPAWPRLGTRSRPAWSWADRLGGQRACGGSFFERLDHPLVLLGVLRPGADVGEGQRDEKVGDRPLAIDHAKAFFDHPFQVNPPPANHTVNPLDRGPFRRSPTVRPSARRSRAGGGPHRDGSSSVCPSSLMRCAQSLSVWRSMRRP